MNRAWRSKLAVTLAGSSAIVIGIFACSGGSRPSVADDPGYEGPLSEAGPSTRTDGGDSGPLPETCTNGKKDGNETDIDCGGNVCGKCIDGKACIALTDCAGGACANNKCLTPHCDDKQLNGDETDFDCGGAACASCTYGKRCVASTDCLTGNCTGKLCGCPKGMTEVSPAGGGKAYCIDEIEVTKYQYNQFLTSGSKVEDQDPICKGVNTLFVPRDAWQPNDSPPNIKPPGAGLNFNLALPVHYVDWCDAYAYCKWAKKQLCGSPTGGPVALGDSDQAAKDAWYNACSTQGAKDYPYGPDFDPNRCNGFYVADAGATASCGPEAQQRNNFGCTANHDDGLFVTNNGNENGEYNTIYSLSCSGGVTGLYHMVGNVAEWENSCDDDAGTCRIRGGSYRSDGNPSALSCRGQRMEKRVPAANEADSLADVGIRCCLY